MTPLTDSGEIRNAFDRLRRNIQRGTEIFKGRVHCARLGELAGTPKDVHWDRRHNINSCMRLHPTKTRYWCAYGAEYPGERPGRCLHISCEINPPFKGINRRVSGAFLENGLSSRKRKRVYYAHNGKLNLTVEGRRVGRNEILDCFAKLGWRVKHIPQLGRMIILGSVDDRSTVSNIALFVQIVEVWRRSK